MSFAPQSVGNLPLHSNADVWEQASVPVVAAVLAIAGDDNQRLATVEKLGTTSGLDDLIGQATANNLEEASAVLQKLKSATVDIPNQSTSLVAVAQAAFRADLAPTQGRSVASGGIGL